MPTARISVPVKQTTPPKTEAEASLKTPASVARPKARVAPRRRARRRGEEVTDSEEELVREPRSDSESESDGSTTLDSEDESDFDKDEGDSKSEEIQPTSSKAAASPSSAAEQGSTMFAQPQNWAEAMEDVGINGDGAVEVIEWGDMASHERPTTPPVNAVPSPPPSDRGEERVRGGSTRGSGWVKRKPGETARQAYLHRLNNDPAYVPTVGQFWSHDDRLLEKDLRSLSGWWRGRWQGRGRGMRGRGGFAGFGGRGRGFAGNVGHPVDPTNLPPVERTWTHDGFDELNKEEEQGSRRQNGWSRDQGFSRGRGGFRGRGFFSRGGHSSTRSDSPRGSHAPAPTESHRSTTTSDKLQFGNGTRPWFSMKPEPVWTRQSENFLFKARPTQNQGIRIKLPSLKGQESTEAVVVKLPAQNDLPTRRTSKSISEKLPPHTIAVKLPGSKGKGKQPETYADEDVVTVGPPPMDDVIPSMSLPANSTAAPSTSQAAANGAPTSSGPVASAAMSQSGSITLPDGPPAQASQPILLPEVTPISVPGQPPVQVQAPMAPVASPFQPSPSYGSPYAYGAAVPLPPGIGMLDNGMTYEIATGHAVYLQTPPPPPQPAAMPMPVYNPRPMHLHHASHGSVHFVPHHGHSHSMSMSVSPPAMMTPPLFSLPRQNSRVEIKAPNEEKGKEREAFQPPTTGHTRTSSKLAVHAEPFTPSSQLAPQNAGYYDAQQRAYEDAQHQQQYVYPQGYYYPMGADGAAYGYGRQYVDQTNPYGDAYTQEQYPPPATYY